MIQNYEQDILYKSLLKFYNTDFDFKNKVSEYSQKNKDVKNFKKRLKGQKVTD